MTELIIDMTYSEKEQIEFNKVDNFAEKMKDCIKNQGWDQGCYHYGFNGFSKSHLFSEYLLTIVDELRDCLIDGIAEEVSKKSLIIANLMLKFDELSNRSL